MNPVEKTVDGFRFMPPSLRAWIGKSIPEAPFSGEIPWTPLRRPCREATFSLMTSAGISMKSDPPFDMERETREPTWGDPTCREIRRDAAQADIRADHHHVNTAYMRADMNVIFPLQRFAELEADRVIGRLAPTSYSYYGFQMNPEALLRDHLPAVASRMRQEGVDAVLLTPA
jgi:D-proline reductase (dithiol) PrdB